MILSTDQKIKLKKLFEEKKFSELDFFIESLGNLKELPLNILNIYAVSKVLNINSTIEDYKISAFCFNKIYSEDQSNRDAFNNLILASIKAMSFEYSEKHLISEYKKNNNDPKILEGLAKMNFFYNNMKESTYYYEKLVSISPNFLSIWTSFLGSMNYHYEIDQKKYLDFCKNFDQTFKIDIEKFNKTKHRNEKLKVGFLSADLKYHSVSYFLSGLLKNINKDEIELIAISNLETHQHDQMTRDLKENFNEWHDVSQIDDIKLVQFIRSMNLDVLIDLNGYTYKNRINVLRARCAPIQISWLGYCNSLGVKNIDYLITDPNLIKKGEEDLYSEKIIFMPKIWNALPKPNNLPEIKINKKDKNFFIFGSFNNFQKISLDTIKIWSKILKESNSKLILKNSLNFNVKKSNEILLEKFEKENVDLNKIEILSRTKTAEQHIENFNNIDLSLDTFPKPGVTTSFQSILMGVPVLTMKGFNFNSRCGESINRNLKLEDFIAEDGEDYIKKALLIKNGNKINELYRKEFREKALKSCLFDTETFAKDFTKLIRSL